ncbi:uncharacterized protein Bfra_009928 [Botrytis fragariae]|uniref:Uncharacterized protein n=1 Tax=Botrytis fragariae TaxID=1964551 RepID=A0A8H6EG08_9HELO|nr:uncharacterized protein Bfra_009928 [Botrytis fragariae]KAF5870540.1 hypothetical protein Bfra_009928 [Botrytis fragariae]
MQKREKTKKTNPNPTAPLSNGQLMTGQDRTGQDLNTTRLEIQTGARSNLADDKPPIHSSLNRTLS